MSKHIFSFFDPLLTEPLADNSEYTITSLELLNRLITIIRIKIAEKIIIFNNGLYAECIVISIHKKQIVVQIINFNRQTSLSPNVHIILPLLKKEAFEEVLTATVLYNITSIQFITTEKSITKIPTDYERIIKIFTAASEQSKQFIFPTVTNQNNKKINLLSLQESIHFYQTTLPQKNIFKGYGKQDDTPFYKVIKDNLEKECYLVTCGPEGDFTDQEKKLLEEHSFIPFSYGNITLKSQEAFHIGCALIRTLTL